MCIRGLAEYLAALDAVGPAAQAPEASGPASTPLENAVTTLIEETA